jgi:hypothetical protein
MGAVGYSMGAEPSEGSGLYMKIGDEPINARNIIERMPVTLQRGIFIDDLLRLELSKSMKGHLTHIRDLYGTKRVPLIQVNDVIGVSFQQFKQLVKDYCDD